MKVVLVKACYAVVILLSITIITFPILSGNECFRLELQIHGAQFSMKFSNS
jgi:hypothetical protein